MNKVVRDKYREWAWKKRNKVWTLVRF